MNEKLAVALYVRVSTEEQAEEGFSIEGQINELSQYCMKNSYDVVKIYKDEGYSAGTMNRPALTELLNDCGTGLFNIVMVWDVSRLSRNLHNSLKILEELSNKSISFFSYTEKNWATTPNDKLSFQIMGAVSEFQRNQLKTRVKLGMNERATKGKWNGGIMLGYTSVNKQLRIIEDEAQIVKYIFNLYISGKGLKAITNQLNHEGYKTKKGKPFGTSAIREILRNPAYAGFIRFNKQQDWEEKKRKGTNKDPIIVKGEHQPIIDIDTWQKSQSIMKQKSFKPAKTFTGYFPLSTLLRCPVCEAGMVGHWVKKSKNSNEYIRYYQCGTFNSKGSAVCKSNMVRADYAEEKVYKRLEEVASDMSILKIIVENVNKKIKTYKEPLQNQLNYTEKQIKQVNSNIQKYFQLFEGDKLPIDLIKNKLTALHEESQTLERQKKEITNELNRPTIKEISFDEVYLILSNFANILPIVEPDKQKNLLHSIINKITINQSKNIDGRSIKDIELFFDTSFKPNDFVLTYGTVHRTQNETASN